MMKSCELHTWRKAPQYFLVLQGPAICSVWGRRNTQTRGCPYTVLLLLSLQWWGKKHKATLKSRKRLLRRRTKVQIYSSRVLFIGPPVDLTIEYSHETVNTKQQWKETSPWNHTDPDLYPSYGTITRLVSSKVRESIWKDFNKVFSR